MFETIWIWAILSAVLLAIELLSGTFYLLWFGIGAGLVALTLWLAPNTSLALQLALFTLSSVTALTVWHKFYKKQAKSSKIGQSHDDTLGRIGIITQPVSAETIGEISFAIPVMGSKTWMAISNDTITPGQHAVIASIEGNYLNVQLTHAGEKP